MDTPACTGTETGTRGCPCTGTGTCAGTGTCTGTRGEDYLQRSDLGPR